MNVNYVVSLIAVMVLCLLAYVGAGPLGLEGLFGIILPYLAVVLFIYGVIYRLVGWARSPVPFRITTTAGQQETLPWIKQDKFENPSGAGGVVVRMLLEVFLFRSLFRNTSATLDGNGKLNFRLEKWLWLFSLAFHYAFLAVILRHLRFFLEPVPAVIQLLETLDGFLQVGLPVMMLSGVVLLGAVTFLFLRRLFIGRVRYISLATDYFPLFLIFGIAFSGLLMRYFTKASVVEIKELAMGLVTFHPVVPEGIDVIFYIHLFLVCVLLAYFPFSKLMHMAGIFLSPTRNMT